MSASAAARPGLLGRAGRWVSRRHSPTNLVVAVVLIALALWAGGANPFINLIGQSAAIFAIAAVGQSILVGGAGQIAFSGGAFMAIGAFTAGILARNGVENFFVILVASAAAGFIVGLISGLPGLRFRGLYLLLSSIALQFIVTSLTRQYQHAESPSGFVVPLLEIGPFDLSSGPPMYVLIIVILLVIFLGTAAVERTGVGLAWKALRESEMAAAMSGIDVVRWKLYAFAASGAVTAVAGCLFAYWVGRVDYETYNLNLTISLVTMVFIGGVTSRLGAVLGAVIITATPYFLQSQVSVSLVQAGVNFDWYLNNQSIVNAGLFALLFLLVVLFEPRGLMGLLEKIEAAVRSLVGRRGSRRGTRS
ncbi:MAG TPA: branched-chain amino acid ABC transporter permease [Pseudolysinimonas sp.]|nr:branched-chain amino acid ABC transporter permease [Pseudolysinimonas sp.]